MLININEKKNLEVPDNLSILQACSLYNIYIPRFCYHEKLSIAGNCRMCLVEVKGVLKPIASCAMPINKDMQIFTDSALVKKSREGILEFILINHPLDCPICDQGGECDLQDQSLLYGNDKGRFYDLKRSVKDKECGPLIKTIMTRCIQCTRCVRFMREISGLNFLGIVGRGNSMEISNFLQKSLFSEVSGNIIDVCPVGALTSKPYSFVARPWELSSFNTIDLNDVMHVNIRVDVRDMKILRILPRMNSKLNENWISDATRFSYDGFFLNRLSAPYIKNNSEKFSLCSWLNVLFLLKKLTFKKINFIIGDFIDAETNAVVKHVCNSFGNFSILNTKQGNSIKNDFRFDYFFNYNFFNKIDSFNSIFLFNTNLRLENPLLNLRIKKLVDKNLIKVFSFGSSFGYNFLNYNFGNSFSSFIKFIEGKNVINNFFTKNSKVLLIFNWSFLVKFKNSLNFYFLKNNVLNFLKDKIFFSVLNYDASFLLSLDFNLINSINNFNDFSFKKKFFDKNLFYFLNTDFLSLTNNNKINKLENFFIFQGNYALKDKKMLDLVNLFLPSSHFIEKNSTFINFFGLIQKTKFILFPFKNVRSDSKIVFILFKHFLKNKRFEILSFFNKYNFFNFDIFFPKIKNKYFLLKINNILSDSFITNFYKNNVLLKKSLIMSSCYSEVKKVYTNFV